MVGQQFEKLLCVDLGALGDGHPVRTARGSPSIYNSQRARTDRAASCRKLSGGRGTNAKNSRTTTLTDTVFYYPSGFRWLPRESGFAKAILAGGKFYPAVVGRIFRGECLSNESIL